MYSSSNSQDSDYISSLGKRQTNLQKFLSKINSQLLKQMKTFLYANRNKWKPDAGKICLYQDILAIVTLKQKQYELFTIKGQARKVIKQIAEKLNRKQITINQRLKKKICHLSPDQLRYYLRNNKDISFQGNSRNVNTDEWPDWLKRARENQIVQNYSSDIINLDQDDFKSNSLEQPILTRNNQNIKNKENQNNKKDILQQIQEIMNQPQTNKKKQANNVYSQIQIKDSSNQAQKQNLNNSLELFFEDPNQRQILSNRVIQDWKQKILYKNQETDKQNLYYSQICYNFKKREYIFINPEIIRSVYNKIKQEELRQKIKMKQISRRKNSNNVQIQMFSPQKNAFLGSKQNNLIQHQQKDMKQIRSSIPATKIRVSNRKNADNSNKIIQINDSVQNLSQKNQPNKVDSSKNPVQILQEMARKYDLSQISDEARNLLEKGLQISSKLKIRLKDKTNQPYDRIIEIQQDQNKKDHQEFSHQDRQMIYWFSNNQKKYETYLEDPYGKGYLMWCDDEDELLYKVNDNFSQNLQQFQCLIKFKTSELVNQRIKFLKIKLNVELRNFLNKLILK